MKKIMCFAPAVLALVLYIIYTNFPNLRINRDITDS